MLANGATSMWEHWSLDARSRGHYFLGTVDDWFFHHVAGIRTTDGYRSVTIAPAVTGDLEWARASTQTPYGPVTSDWRTRGRTLELRVDVPVGSVATVHVPAENVHAVTESGEPLDEADGVRSVRDNGDTVLVTVGSGRYAFAADEQMALSGRVLERIDALRDAVRAAGLRRSDERALLRSLDDAAEGRRRRCKELRRGDVTDAAEALARSLRALDDYDDDLRAATRSWRRPRCASDRRGDHRLPRRAADRRRGPGDGAARRSRERARRRRQRRPRDPARRPRALTGAVAAGGAGGEAAEARRRGRRRGGARWRARRRRLARRGSRGERLAPRATGEAASRSRCRRRSRPATSPGARGCGTRSTAPRSSPPRR